MTLEEYLELHNMSARYFAKAIHVSHTTVNSIIKGKRPKRDVAFEIESYTHREVKAKELLLLEKRKPKIIYS